MGRSCCDRRSGLAQDLVQLILERQFFSFQRLDVTVGGRFDTRLHVLDPLIEFVVLFEEVEEMAVGRLELGDQVAVFGKPGAGSRAG